MSSVNRVINSLKLKKEISTDLKRCIDRKNVIKEKACPYCRSKEYVSNGNKINSKGNKVPRYLCNQCKKTFYKITNENKRANVDYPLDYYSLQIRKEYGIFLLFLHMYLRVEYERMLRRIIKEKDNYRYKEAKTELDKVSKKMTNKDILEKIAISERTLVRWRNKTRKDLERIVGIYSDSPLDDAKWFDFLQEANHGYGLRSGNSSEEKLEFDRMVLWLIILAEDKKE